MLRPSVTNHVGVEEEESRQLSVTYIVILWDKMDKDVTFLFFSLNFSPPFTVSILCKKMFP